jgi:NAD(P)H-hydrate epimerase
MARRLAKKTGAVVVLKGAGSIVTDERFMAVCNAGNPGMAKAGSGDVLAGILGALAAQRMSLFDSAYAAVMFHAAAADVAAAKMPRGYMLPQDTIACLQEVQ